MENIEITFTRQTRKARRIMDRRKEQRTRRIPGIERERTRKRVYGVKSSRSPRISVGFFTEFIFNEVALSHARSVLARFSGKLPRIPVWPHGSSSNHSLSFSLRREKTQEWNKSSGGRLRKRIGRGIQQWTKGSPPCFYLFLESPSQEHKTTRVHGQDSFASFERS